MDTLMGLQISDQGLEILLDARIPDTTTLSL